MRVNEQQCEEGRIGICTNRDVQMLPHPVSYENGNTEDWVVICDPCHKAACDDA